MRHCPVCGGSELVKLISAVGELRYCCVCFHGWRAEAPTYSYDAVAMCPLGTSAERLQSQISFFERFLPKGGRVLEIGCATGELAAATRRRLDVASYDAIELSPAAELAEARVDRLHRRPLRELIGGGVLESKFDLVIVSHVLEHLEDPKGELQAIVSVLEPDGALFLEVPNRSGNVRLPIDDNRSHIQFFTTSSLTRLLTHQGMETVAATTGERLDARYADSLRVIAKPFSTPSWPRTLLSDQPAFQGGEAIVVWGAGSLVDEVLANFFDASRIDYFIDKDPAKQGGSRLGRPVAGPEALGDTPRTVLINSIDFADSIAADINERYPNAGHRLVRIGDVLDG